MAERSAGDEALEGLVKKTEDEEEQTKTDDNPGSSVDIPVLKLEEENSVDSLPSETENLGFPEHSALPSTEIPVLDSPPSKASSSSSSSSSPIPELLVSEIQAENADVKDSVQSGVDEDIPSDVSELPAIQLSPSETVDPPLPPLESDQLEQQKVEETIHQATPMSEELAKAYSGLVTSGEFSQPAEIKEKDPPSMDDPCESHLPVEDLEVSRNTHLVDQLEQREVEVLSQRESPISEELVKAYSCLVASGEFSPSKEIKEEDPPLMDNPCEGHLTAEELEVSKKTHLVEEQEQREVEETSQRGTPFSEEVSKAYSCLVARGEFSPSKEIKEEDPSLMDDQCGSHLTIEDLEVSRSSTHLVEEQEQWDVEEMSQRGTPIYEELAKTYSCPVESVEEVVSGDLSPPNESKKEDPSLMHDPCESHLTVNIAEVSRNTDLERRASWISCCGLFDVIRDTKR